MTIAEKMEQEKAYKEYEKHIAQEFANSEDGEFEISQDESKEWKHLNQSNQTDEIIDENEPNLDS